MAFTKIVGAGIHTLSNVHTHNINSSGIITATQFVGVFTGGGGNLNSGIVTCTTLDVNGNGDISGNLVVDGNFTVNGTTTTLDTALTEVDKVEVAANTSTVGVAITQSGSGDILRLYDGTAKVLAISDDGKVGIGSLNAQSKLHVAGVSTTVWPFSSAVVDTYAYTPYPHEVVIDNDVRGVEGSFAGIYFNAGADTDGSKVSTARIAAVDSGDYKADLVFANRGFNSGGGFDDHRENVRIKYNGNVGIGTNNPGFKLDVDYSGGEDGIRILNRGTASGSTSMLRLGNDENINAAFLMLNSSGYGSVGGAYNLVLGHGLNRDIVFSTGGSEKVRILSGGNVGIGSAIPTDKLDIQTGSSDEVTKFKVKTAGQLELTRNHADAPYIKTFMSSGNPEIRLGDSSGDRTVIKVDGVTYFNGGKVGIGLTNPEIFDAAANHLVIQDSGNCGLTIDSTSGTKSSIYFADGADGNEAYRGWVQYTNSDGTNSDYLTLGTAAEERLRIHSDGSITQNYGNPNASAVFRISKNGSGAAELRFDTATANTANLYLGDDEQLRIRYGGTEHTRFTSTGRVGIGLTNPSSQLHISSGASGDCILILEADTDNAGSELDNPYIKFVQDGGIEESVVGMNPYGTDGENNALVLANSIANNGGIIFKTGTTNGYTNASEKMRIKTSGEVQIGSNEGGYRLNVTRESSDTTTAETQLLLYSKHDGTGNTGVGFGGGIRFWGDRNSDNVEQNMGRIMCIADVNSGTNISGALIFETGRAGVVGERVRITSGDCASFGNSTPPAWDSGAGYYNIQLGNAGYFRADTDASSNFLSFGLNAYRDNTNWKFVEDGRATQVSHQGGEIFFNTSNNGSAGGAITFTERFRLTAGGDVQIKVDGSGGTSSQQGVLRFVRTAYSNNMKDSRIVFDTSSASNNSDNNTYCSIIAGQRTTSNNGSSRLSFYTCNSDNSYVVGERLRITEDGLIQTKTRSAGVRRMILSGSPSNSAFNIEAHDGATGTSAGTNQGELGLYYNDGTTLTDEATIKFYRGAGAGDGYLGFVAGENEKVRILHSGNNGRIAHFRDGTSAADSKAYITLQTGYPFSAPNEGACQIGVVRNGSGNQSHFSVRTSNGSTMAEALRINHTKNAFFTADIFWSGAGGNAFNNDYGRLTTYTSSSSAYGFNFEHSTHLLMLNQQGGTNQAMVLADISSGTGSGKVLWGVSITGGGGANNLDGGESWSQKARVEGNGAFVHAGAHSASGSDDRLKKNKVGITSALSKVCAMEGFTYEWNDVADKIGMSDGDKHLGLSAQTVEPLVPEVVVVNDMLVNPDDGTNDYKTIRYERLVPLLVEAIKDLKADNDALKARISALEGS